jgi:hypothetical protein
MKKFGLPQILLCVAVLLGIVALILPVANGATVTDSETAFGVTMTVTEKFKNAYALIFGGKVTESAVVSSSGTTASSTADAMVSAAILPLIGWILVVIGVIAAIVALVFGLLGKEIPGGKIILFVAAGTLVVGGILLFCGKQEIATNLANSWPVGGSKSSTAADADTVKTIADHMKLGFGFIGTGIAAIAGGVAAIVPAFVGEKK